MDNIVKMNVFKGQGSKDPEKFWFVAKDVWKAQKINDEDMKKYNLVTTLQDKASSWYIKYSITNPATSLADTKKAMNTKFKKPKSQSQCITEIKEIKKVVNGTYWE